MVGFSVSGFWRWRACKIVERGYRTGWYGALILVLKVLDGFPKEDRGTLITREVVAVG